MNQYDQCRSFGEVYRRKELHRKKKGIDMNVLKTKRKMQESNSDHH
jgi:hypothetical protein